MIIEFIIGVMLLGSLFHLSFGIWKIKVPSPFGSSSKSNIWYGIFVLGISLGLYVYKCCVEGGMENYVYIGGLFAVVYTVVFGLWVTRKNGN